MTYLSPPSSLSYSLQAYPRLVSKCLSRTPSAISISHSSICRPVSISCTQSNVHEGVLHLFTRFLCSCNSLPAQSFLILLVFLRFQGTNSLHGTDLSIICTLSHLSAHILYILLNTVFPITIPGNRTACGPSPIS